MEGEISDHVGYDKHEPERFAGLFDRYVEQIHRYVARRLGVQAADDIVAETFLTAFRCRVAYDHTQRLALPWLYGMATNLIARHRRDEERFPRALSRTGVSYAWTQGKSLPGQVGSATRGSPCRSSTRTAERHQDGGGPQRRIRGMAAGHP
ncbi:sigma-70 family RNA polymerase sigma factor [Nonomuraea sp. NPDC048881]|uniref:RNA polymerase sigma factor n=1 Tax=Nonomuraea sp. NPDC048881 TaxID=3155030 RepID=UPI0033F2048D